jgi:hypothetical protein
MLSVIVPTYQRPASLSRLARSLAQANVVCELVVVAQSPIPVLHGARVVLTEPGLPGPRRHLGAVLANGDLLLFLDDDHEILPEFGSWLPFLTRWVMQERILLQLPLRSGYRHVPKAPIALAGGFMVSRETYNRVGGFGDDYLDDIEFSLRCVWHGVPLRRFWRVVTRHHGGTAGGLRALPGVEPKRDAHARLSRLDERYPGRLVRDARSWWGFRMVRNGPEVE